MAEENNNPLDPDSDTPTPVPASPTPSTSLAGLTPGQRLAAKKAQKAVQKREFKDELKRNEELVRQKEQEEADKIFGRAQAAEPALPDNVQKVAGGFSDFLHDHKEKILAALVGALILGGLGVGAKRLLSAGDTEHASALGAALDIASAPIDAEDKDGKTDDGKPLFKSTAERASKAQAAFAAVAKEGGEGAPTWALLAQAATEVELGKFADAQKHFQVAYDAQADHPEIAARSLEGVGIALEGAGKVDEAQKAFEKLKSVDLGKQLAAFHLARLALAKGERDEAKTMLKGLFDELKSPTDGAPSSGYLRNEVEVRLAELDPSQFASSSGGPMVFDPSAYGNDPSKMSSEQIKKLIESLQKGQAAPGATPGTDSE